MKPFVSQFPIHFHETQPDATDQELRPPLNSQSGVYGQTVSGCGIFDNHRRFVSCRILSIYGMLFRSW